ncbi:hypothetical protein [Ideonella sp. BN130291]|uniref:hypothetical protein n=1 Tax=Ideonella sp. BN130291 TaxID=3112940 RepID=UPI002E253EAB|nr:hypothetical protein [Ideonella sp. BN130291]
MLHRYLARQYVELFFSTGSIRIGSLGLYRDMENSKSDLLRGDAAEGVSRTTVLGNHDELTPENIPPSLRGIIGFSPPEPGQKRTESVRDIRFEGFEIDDSARNLYVMCLSNARSYRLARHFGVDACISILDTDSFFASINRRLQGSARFLGVHNCV